MNDHHKSSPSFNSKEYQIAQAYLEYSDHNQTHPTDISENQRYDTDEGSTFSVERQQGRFFGRLVMAPEYFLARRAFRRIKKIRGSTSDSLDDVAERLKQDFESALYGKIPLWSTTPKGQIDALQRLTESKVYPELMGRAIIEILRWGDESGYAEEAREKIHGRSN